VTKDAEFTPARKFGIDRLFLTVKKPKRTEFTVVRRIGNIQGYVDGTGYLSLAGSVTIRIEWADADGVILRFEPKSHNKEKDEARGREGLSLYSI
jgi:hypothetical protein